jgi:hypothetical protein
MPESKIAPTEAKSREQREARVPANKKLIATRVKAKGIGKVVNIKTLKRGRRRAGQAKVR